MVPRAAMRPLAGVSGQSPLRIGAMGRVYAVLGLLRGLRGGVAGRLWW